MLHLVQLTHPDFGRCVAVVEDEYLFCLNTFSSIYALAMQAIKTGIPLESIIADDRSPDRMVYDPIYTGTSDWNLLPAFDHPEEPARCLVTGTGLTHKASVDNRQAMHEEAGHTEITDSMRIFQMGLEGGKPESGKIGVQPEWFYNAFTNDDFSFAASPQDRALMLREVWAFKPPTTATADTDTFDFPYISVQKP